LPLHSFPRLIAFTLVRQLGMMNLPEEYILFFVMPGYIYPGLSQGCS
jgi:hypothetical protein